MTAMIAATSRNATRRSALLEKFSSNMMFCRLSKWLDGSRRQKFVTKVQRGFPLAVVSGDEAT
jgi:hypothetical protein